MTNLEFEKIITDTVSRIPEPKTGLQGVHQKIAQANAAEQKQKKKRIYRFRPAAAAILAIFLLGASVLATSPINVGAWHFPTIVPFIELDMNIDFPETLGGARLVENANYLNLCTHDTSIIKAFFRPLYQYASIDYDATAEVITNAADPTGPYYSKEIGNRFYISIGKMDDSGYWAYAFNMDEETLEYLGAASDSERIHQMYPSVDYKGYTLYIEHSAFTNPETGNQSTSVIWVDPDKNLVFGLSDSYGSDQEINIDRAVQAAKEFIDYNE